MFHLFKKAIADRWHRLSISRQLLIFVNTVLTVLVVLFLSMDYRIRMSQHLHEKQVALSEEAKTIFESFLHVEKIGGNAIQHLLDNICARMNASDSPGHHIAAEWQGREYQAQSHGHASSEMMAALKGGKTETQQASLIRDRIVVGEFRGTQGAVYVSEDRGAIVGEIRHLLILQTVAVLLMGTAAAFVVNAVLRQLIAKPIRGFVNALQSVADGNLTVIASTRSCKELGYLADQINVMTKKLRNTAQDHRVHMEKARQIQRHLLPKSNGLSGIAVADLFEPAEEVGGDYYDVIPLPEQKYLLCLADVAGHGVPAAMAATVIKSLVLEAIQFTTSPAEMLTRINRRYAEIIMPGHFATMVVLVIDTINMTLSCASAGHEPPFIQQSGLPVERLLTGGLVLGVNEEVCYDEETRSVAMGTRVLLVSDGVTEAFDPEDNQFGTERISEALQELSADCDINDVVQNLKSRLSKFRGTRPAFDDTTLLAVELQMPAEVELCA
ncbi:MAG: SpoIIE family protein phosphatase [Planctomycetales bacterium]|nr:SpoIIE family protein phosphatase [Planctomycetales bacterium]